MKYAFVISIYLSIIGNIHAQNADYVNVFIGTEGTGHTFPGPSMPFGMVQPGPDNKDYGWDYTSGYQYRDTFLLGFSQTRLSGTGINELGDVLLLPINSNKEALSHFYTKQSEIGKVGYYAVTKKDDVNVELTCSERVAFHSYTFPEPEATVFVDLQHGLRFVFDHNAQGGLVLESDVTVANNRTISGYCSTKNWVDRKYYFIIEFEQPFSQLTRLEPQGSDKAPKYTLNFSLPENKQLQVKIALSSVSVEGARRNLQEEIPHWNFEAVYEKNLNTWNTYLNRIDIEASSKKKQILY